MSIWGIYVGLFVVKFRHSVNAAGILLFIKKINTIINIQINVEANFALVKLIIIQLKLQIINILFHLLLLLVKNKKIIHGNNEKNCGIIKKFLYSVMTPDSKYRLSYTKLNPKN